MTAQPRDLAAEVDIIREVHRLGGSQHKDIDTLLEYIAELDRELEDLRRPLAELKKEAESEEGMEPQRMMQYLCRRVDALQKETRRLQPDNERLRAENERLSRDYNTARDAHDRRAAELAEAQSQLTALRRPLQSDAAAAIALGKEQLAVLDAHGARSRAIEALLSALDATARQLRERVEMLEAAQGEIQRLSKSHEQVCNLHQSISNETFQEIARLSSPPQERAEIVGRQAERNTVLARWDFFCGVTAQQAIADIDALLGDCAAWRNAHQDRVEMLSFVQDALTERNRECVELRERCGRLEAERDQLKAAKLQHDSQQRAAALALYDDRIERLEAALRYYADIETYTTTWDATGAHQPLMDDDQCGNRARAALAAADGQQPKFCAYEDCDLDPAPSSGLCQGHIDFNAAEDARQRARRIKDCAHGVPADKCVRDECPGVPFAQPLAVKQPSGTGDGVEGE